MSRYSFSVPDMSCDHCKMRISKALESAGLREFTVDLENKTVAVEALDAEVPRKAIEEAGYDAALQK